MGTCTNCGQELTDDQKFCRGCGTPNQSSNGTSNQTPYETPNQSPYETPNQTPYGTPNQGGYVPKNTPAFFSEYIAIWKNYANFKDRTTRRGYWMVFVYNLMITIPLFVLGLIPYIGFLFSIVSVLYSLAFIVPSAAVMVRRLHDVGKSGKLVIGFYALSFINTLVSICSFVFLLLVQPSEVITILCGLVNLVLTLGTLGLGIYLIVLLCKPSIAPDGRAVV